MFNRIAGALLLSQSLFDEVEQDRKATVQAVLVVFLVTLLNAVGSLLLSRMPPYFIQGRQFVEENGIEHLFEAVPTIFWGVVGFFVITGTVHLVGDRVFGGSSRYIRLVRTLGFAISPMLAGALRFIPYLGDLLFMLGIVWTMAAMIIATQSALKISFVKSLGSLLLGFILFGAGVIAVGLLTTVLAGGY